VKSIPQKSKLKYIAHNPTGELMRVLIKEFKKRKIKGYEINSRTNSK
jgi:hypothetical protein